MKRCGIAMLGIWLSMDGPAFASEIDMPTGEFWALFSGMVLVKVVVVGSAVWFLWRLFFDKD